MTYRIVVDRAACGGFGSCVDIDPETFGLASDGLVVAYVETTGREAVVQAARSCPMGAIRVIDDP